MMVIHDRQQNRSMGDLRRTAALLRTRARCRRAPSVRRGGGSPPAVDDGRRVRRRDEFGLRPPARAAHGAGAEDGLAAQQPIDRLVELRATGGIGAAAARTISISSWSKARGGMASSFLGSVGARAVRGRETRIRSVLIPFYVPPKLRRCNVLICSAIQTRKACLCFGSGSPRAIALLRIRIRSMRSSR